MKTVCAYISCPNLVEDTGPEITEASYCPEHKIFYDPADPANQPLDLYADPPPMTLEEIEIDGSFRRLQSLALDHVKYQRQDVLVEHFETKVVPAVRRVVATLQASGNEHRLLDLPAIGYRVTLNDAGQVEDVKVRRWNEARDDWGP